MDPRVRHEVDVGRALDVEGVSTYVIDGLVEQDNDVNVLEWVEWTAKRERTQRRWAPTVARNGTSLQASQAMGLAMPVLPL